MKSNSHCKPHLNLHSNALDRRTKDTMQRWANVMSVRVDFLVSIKRHWRRENPASSSQPHRTWNVTFIYWLFMLFWSESTPFFKYGIFFWLAWMKKVFKFSTFDSRRAIPRGARLLLWIQKGGLTWLLHLLLRCKANLLRKISKVQSGQTSGIVCSRNKKNDDFCWQRTNRYEKEAAMHAGQGTSGRKGHEINWRLPM
jgi:hypothetical protein